MGSACASDYLSVPLLGEHEGVANFFIVSEPIGLKLRKTSGDVYLYAQIFTGFMYIAAALCMWFLRAWKVGELEQIAAEHNKSLESVDATSDQTLKEHIINPSRGREYKSSLVKRLFRRIRV